MYFFKKQGKKKRGAIDDEAKKKERKKKLWTRVEREQRANDGRAYESLARESAVPV